VEDVQERFGGLHSRTQREKTTVDAWAARNRHEELYENNTSATLENEETFRDSSHHAQKYIVEKRKKKTVGIIPPDSERDAHGRHFRGASGIF